jgi:hypothetical protein
MEFLKNLWATKTGKVLIVGVGVVLFLAFLGAVGVLPAPAGFPTLPSN